MADGIRPCIRKDFMQITNLHQEMFRSKQQHDSGNLHRYLEQAYLDNPWTSQSIPSLVSEKAGKIDGFLGVIPQKMQFRGSQITTAVSSALMVAKDRAGKRNPITGVSLLRRFLRGDQDLSLTDTANDVTRKIWTASGGSIAHPYCYTWMRPLKPLKMFLDIGLKSDKLVRMMSPVLGIGDAVLRRMPPVRPQPSDCEITDINVRELLELNQQAPRRAIMPDYDLESLTWLVQMAEQSETEGPLTKRLVRSQTGKVLGWFVYYRSRNATGRVLQLVGHPNSFEPVLDSLFHDASQHGLAALWGRTEPGQNRLLTKKHCVFRGTPWVLVHSKQQEIVESFQRADALFTGFDGEHWMKTNA